MCGIAGFYLKRPDSLDAQQLEYFLDELLLGIEPRGDHATGFVAVQVGGKGVVLGGQEIQEEKGAWGR